MSRFLGWLSVCILGIAVLIDVPGFAQAKDAVPPELAAQSRSKRVEIVLEGTVGGRSVSKTFVIPNPTYITDLRSLRTNPFVMNIASEISKGRFLFPDETVKDAEVRFQECLADTQGREGRRHPIEASAISCLNLKRDWGFWNSGSGAMVVESKESVRVTVSNALFPGEDYLQMNAASAMPPVNLTKEGGDRYDFGRLCFGPVPTDSAQLKIYKESCAIPSEEECGVGWMSGPGTFRTFKFSCERFCGINGFTNEKLVRRLLSKDPKDKTRLQAIQAYERAGNLNFQTSIKDLDMSSRPHDDPKWQSFAKSHCLKCPSEMKVIRGKCIDSKGCSFPEEVWDISLKNCRSIDCNPNSIGSSPKVCAEGCKERCEEKRNFLSSVRMNIDGLARDLGGSNGSRPIGYYRVGSILASHDAQISAAYLNKPNETVQALLRISNRLKEQELKVDNEACQSDSRICSETRASTLEQIDRELEKIFGVDCVQTGHCGGESRCKACQNSQIEYQRQARNLLTENKYLGNCPIGMVELSLKRLFFGITMEFNRQVSDCIEGAIKESSCKKVPFPTEQQLLQHLTSLGIDCQARPVPKSSPGSPGNTPPVLE